MADHVHLLVRLNQNLCLADFMKKLKANSSGWAARTNGKKFKWQEGYGAFSVSESQIERVRNYVRNQEQHHRRGLSFDDEVATLLKAHHVEFKVEYLWR